MTAETTAGYRISEGQMRFNRIATLFLIACGINYVVYLYTVQRAVSEGTPVPFYEWHEPNVINFDGQHVRVEPEVYQRTQAYSRISGSLLIVSFALRVILFLVNARLSASKPQDPQDDLGPIRIASDGVAHVGGSQYPVLLPRGQVDRLELQLVSPVDHPVGATVCGAFFVLLGTPIAVGLGPRIEDFEMFGAFCLFAGVAIMGAWIILFSWKKRYVLVAHTPAGAHRMMFHYAAAKDEVVGFLRGAALRHGYRLSFGKGL
ncbi:MAG TPA: hypothetical protein VFR31_21000 [Thermoanaerobaculia bacterium]|nr:hypothetical protein [Thermoanaerobaculia bacterium]